MAEYATFSNPTKHDFLSSSHLSPSSWQLSRPCCFFFQTIIKWSSRFLPNLILNSLINEARSLKGNPNFFATLVQLFLTRNKTLGNVEETRGRAYLKYEHIGVSPCSLPCQNLPLDKGQGREKPSVAKYAYNSSAQETQAAGL